MFAGVRGGNAHDHGAQALKGSRRGRTGVSHHGIDLAGRGCGGAQRGSAALNYVQQLYLELLGFHHGIARHTSVLDRDPLGTQPSRLFPVLTRSLRKHDPTAGTDYPMPRYIGSIG